MIGKGRKYTMDIEGKCEKKGINTKDMVLMGLMAAVLCVLGPISFPLPISPVSVSLTSLGIYLGVYTLGGKKGCISCLVYLFIGFVGLPVFSGFTAGAGKLFGPTGGYLIGYVFMALISGCFIEKYPARFWKHLTGMLLGIVVCYLFGTVWLSFQANMDFRAALLAGVFPFLPGDVVKIGIALGMGQVVRKRLKQAGLN